MIFWFRRSSTKHAVIKYTREVRSAIILSVSDRGRAGYRWYIAFLQHRVSVISRDAYIIGYNYDGVCTNILLANAEAISAK